MNETFDNRHQHSEERTHKQVLVIRKDLKMRQGKAVSQGSHAALAGALCRSYVQDNELRIPLDADVGPWLLGRFTKTVVHVPDEASLLAIHKQAQDAGLPCALIQDAGLTEFKGVPTYTAVAVGPALKETVDRITGHLPLL